MEETIWRSRDLAEIHGALYAAACKPSRGVWIPGCSSSALSYRFCSLEDVPGGSLEEGQVRSVSPSVFTTSTVSGVSSRVTQWRRWINIIWCSKTHYCNSRNPNIKLEFHHNFLSSLHFFKGCVRACACARARAWTHALNINSKMIMGKAGQVEAKDEMKVMNSMMTAVSSLSGKNANLGFRRFGPWRYGTCEKSIWKMWRHFAEN